MLAVFLAASMLFAAGEEIPELEADRLEENWLQEFYSELGSGSYKLKLNSRSRITGDNWNSLFGLKISDGQLNLNTNLLAERKDQITGNFTLSRLSPKSTLKELHLGYYRPVWASGIIFSRTAQADDLLEIKPAPHPRAYSPVGVSALVGKNGFSGFALASWQERGVTLKDDKISYLYKYKTDKMSRAEEAILSAGVQYSSAGLALGSLLYYQTFDRDFSNSAYSQSFTAASIAAGYQAKAFRIQAEGASLNGQSALQAEAELELPSISQRFCFSTRKASQIPVYAARPTLLSANGKGYEVDWDLELELKNNYLLGFRQAAFNNSQSLKSPRWLARNSIYLQTDPRLLNLLLQFTRLDREIIAAQDTSYLHTRPVHYRVLLKMQPEIATNLNFRMQFRYQREDRISVKNDGIYWENAFVFKLGKLRLETGLKSWQSSRSLIFEDADSENPSGSALVTGDEFSWFLAPGFKWKSLRLKAEITQSLSSGDTSFYLSAGI